MRKKFRSCVLIKKRFYSVPNDNITKSCWTSRNVYSKSLWYPGVCFLRLNRCTYHLCRWFFSHIMYHTSRTYDQKRSGTLKSIIITQKKGSNKANVVYVSHNRCWQLFAYRRQGLLRLNTFCSDIEGEHMSLVLSKYLQINEWVINSKRYTTTSSRAAELQIESLFIILEVYYSIKI